MQRLSQNNRRAFTLIELMVVVAIIALLISILLPSLGRAREKARTVACLANLKSLAHASLMYQSDYCGYFPSAGNDTRRLSDWFMWETAYPDDQDSVDAYSSRMNIMLKGGYSATSAQGSDMPYIPPFSKYGAVVSYMGNRFIKKSYLCPSDTDIAKHLAYKYSYTANVNFFNIPGYADPVRATSTRPSILRSPVRYSAIRSPSLKIIMVEEDATATDDAAWAPSHHGAPTGDMNNVIAIRHTAFKEDKIADNGGKGNAAFADGHGEIIERKDAMSPQYYYPYDIWKY